MFAVWKNLPEVEVRVSGILVLIWRRATGQTYVCRAQTCYVVG